MYSLGQDKMADLEKEEVLMRLRKITPEQLEEICRILQVTVKDTKKNKQKATMNAVQRHLASEEIEDSEDEGLVIFQQLNEQLKKMLGEDKKVPVKTETDVNGTSADGGGGGGSSKVSALEQRIREEYEQKGLRSNGSPNPGSLNSAPTIDVKKIKLRDFKITGGTVGKEKGNIKWGSLCFQMKQGTSQGYSERDIMLGVISAMKEGSSEQIFFQLTMDDPQLTQEIFLGMLRSLYGVEDSNKLLDEMVASYQEPTETLMKYVLRMNGYRKNIMSVTAHEDCPLTDGMVRKRFCNSLLVGLRNPTTRLELKPVLLNNSIPDHELMAIVNEITSRETENEKKLGKMVASSKAVEAGDGDGGRNYCTMEEGKILGQLTQLTAQMAQQHAQFQEQKEKIEQLQNLFPQLMFDKKYTTNNDNRRRRFGMKCAKCEEEGIYCKHCAKCGEEGHKKAACPKNE